MKKREMMKWRENYTLWESPCLSEGLYLHCHFDEKDDVKRLGGRWNPAPNGAKGGHWWMPKNQLDNTCPIDDEENWGPGGSGTIQDWLNNHKMIAGQYGRLSAPKCLAYADFNAGQAHQLIGPNRDDLLITVYEEAGVVRFLGNAAAGSDQWLTIMEARETWERLMTSGYRKTIDATSEVSS